MPLLLRLLHYATTATTTTTTISANTATANSANITTTIKNDDNAGEVEAHDDCIAGAGNSNDTAVNSMRVALLQPLPLIMFHCLFTLLSSLSSVSTNGTTTATYY